MYTYRQQYISTTAPKGQAKNIKKLKFHFSKTVQIRNNEISILKVEVSGS